MKNKLVKLLLPSLLMMVMWSCKKDENQIFLEGGTAPNLTPSSTAALVLKKIDANKEAIKFTWTNPDYRFTTGISSQDVTYTLQFDTAGVNFTSLGIQERAFNTDLGVTLTVKDVNGFLSKMELKAGVTYNMEIRIVATLVNKSAPLYSNVVKIQITPYLDYAVEPPGTELNDYLDGNLWVIGDAVSSGWNNPLPSPFDVDQKFRRVDILHYVLDDINFNATGGYKLIQTQGVWSTQ